MICLFFARKERKGEHLEEAYSDLERKLVCVCPHFRFTFSSSGEGGRREERVKRRRGKESKHKVNASLDQLTSVDTKYVRVSQSE